MESSFGAKLHQVRFLTWEWMFSWWEVYGDDYDLYLLTAWEEDALVGVLPLMLAKEKRGIFSFRTLLPLGTPQTDISGILLKDKSETILFEMGEYLLSHKKEWDMLVLNHLVQDDLALIYFKEYFHNAGIRSRERISDHYYISIEGNWDDFLANLSRKFREILRRSARRAAKIGKVSFRYYSGEEASWEVFQKIIEINQYSKYPIIYQSEKEQIFHKKLFARMPEKGLLNIFLLEINNIPVAYQYGFVQNDRYESWRVAYDFRFPRRVSVGKLLFKLATEKSFELGYTEIDFLRGDEAYKLEWKPKTRKYTKIRFVLKNRPLALLFFVWLPQIKTLFSRVKGR